MRRMNGEIFDEGEWEKVEKAFEGLSWNVSGVFKINREAVENYEFVKKTIEDIFGDSDVEIESHRHAMSPGSGCVSVTGNKIIVPETTMFSQAICASEIFEMYTKTDGSVEMDFCFNHLAERVG